MIELHSLTADQIQERLILWTVRHSQIKDLRVRGFTLELCSAYDPETGGVTATHSDLAARLGISTLSAWRYTQELMDSEEWAVKTVKGKQTVYKPTFVEQAIRESGNPVIHCDNMPI